MRSLSVLLLVWTCVATQAIAEPPAVPPPVELLLEGRAIETPVLKYRLFPAESERHDGNAVPILLRLPWEQNPWMTTIAPTLAEWETRPINAPEWGTFESKSIFPDRFYHEIKRAAFRRDAHWEYPIHETATPHEILLNDVQGLRVFLRYGLSARIRYHLSRGELDLAREGILVGIANAKHVAQTPFYITQLVAVSIHRSMLDQAGELISQSSSPNLYWALSSLPDSLIELDQATRLEGHMFEMTFPAARDFDRPRSPEEWTTMARQLAAYLIETELLKVSEKSMLQEFLSFSDVDIALSSLKKKLSRPDLTQRMGIPAEKVAAMSDEEALVRWYTHLHMNLDQYAAAFQSLPPREARDEYRRLKAEAQSIQKMTGVEHWKQISPVGTYVSVWALKRKVASLRVIEAVRHYMATHEGKLPVSLKDIQDLVVPVDPLTDQPFLWQVDGDTATLKSPLLPEEFAEASSASFLMIEHQSMIEYRIRVRAKAP